MAPHPLAFVLLLLTGVADAALPPQGTGNGRDVLLGSVTGRDGQPWEGAKVTLYADRTSKHFDLGAADLVEVVTGPRGRFRAELWPGRPYAAKATIGEGDERRQTAVVRGILAGQPAHLVEAKSQPIALRVAVIGHEAWRKLGPLQVEAADDLGRPHELVLDDQGWLRLPPLGESVTLGFRGANDTVVHRHQATCTPSQRQRREESLRKKAGEVAKDSEPVPGLPDLAKEDLPEPDVERVVLGPPLHARITVTDAKSKKPIAGARITRQDQWNEPLQALATTDAEGRADCVIARPVDAWCRPREQTQILFFVSAPGYARTPVGWSSYEHMGLKPLKDEDIRDGRAPDLAAELSKGFKVTGQVQTRAGIAPADLKLVARVPVAFQLGGGGWTSWHVQELVAVSADGRWQIDGLAQYAWGLAVSLVLAPAQLEAIFGREAGPFATHGTVDVSFGRQVHQVTADIEAKKVDLAELRLVELQLDLPDGRPAARARVVCSQLDDNRSGDETDGIRPAVFSDKRGRARLLVPGTRSVLIIEEAEHYLVQELDPPTKGKAKKDEAASAQQPFETLRLILTPLAAVEGRVVDQDGKPVAEAWVGVRNTHWFAGTQLSNYVSNLNHRLLQGRSDESGRFRLRFVPEKGMQFGLGANKTVDGNTIQQNESLVVVSDESVRDAEIVLPFRQAAAEKAAGQEPPAGK